jgi:transcriptional regulator with XRE-family HTH domain
MTRIGRTLSDARNRKGLSLRAVEAAIGVSNAYLSQLESGKVREPSPNILFKLAELYEVPYQALLSLAGYPLPTNVQSSESLGLAARLGPTSSEEEDALAEYLEFLRLKARGRRTL